MVDISLTLQVRQLEFKVWSHSWERTLGEVPGSSLHFALLFPAHTSWAVQTADRHTWESQQAARGDIDLGTGRGGAFSAHLRTTICSLEIIL